LALNIHTVIDFVLLAYNKWLLKRQDRTVFGIMSIL